MIFDSPEPKAISRLTWDPSKSLEDLGSRVLNGSIESLESYADDGIPELPIEYIEMTSTEPKKHTRKKEAKGKIKVPNLRKTAGSEIYVCRNGEFVPLSSVLQKKEKPKIRENSSIVYVYNDGKLLVVGGSLCHVDIEKIGTHDTKIVMPQEYLPHSKDLVHNLLQNKVKAMYIDQDFAEYALTALTLPSPNKSTNKFIKPVHAISRKSSRSNLSFNRTMSSIKRGRPRKFPTIAPNILDILTEKLDITSSISRNGKSKVEPTVTKVDKSEDTRDKQLFKKNLHRFPSLSREMKRLDVNYVTLNSSSAKVFIPLIVICNCLVN